MSALGLLDELFGPAQEVLSAPTIRNQCSNIQLRLPRVRGLSASMVEQTTFINKEQSYV